MNRFAMLPLTWPSVLSDTLHLGLANLLALPIGWNREREQRSAGLRTFPIVAVAACGFTMLGTSMPGATNDSYSRILQGLITGIGFVGGGAIVRDGINVHGTATAASIWAAGAIGAAVALGRIEIAIVLAVMDVFTMWALVPIKQRLDRRREEVDGPAHRSGNTE